MTSALPANGVMNSNSNQPAIAGQTTVGGVEVQDKSKEWQTELLMEKLRAKASTFKTLTETAKTMRMTMLDKRFAIDSVEKAQLQKCLDALQHSIKVTSLQSMIERLENLSRQLGLKFMMTGPNTELFISSDMFFLEILLEPSGDVKDVKIHHEGKTEQQSCEELVACLSKGDFVDFTTQLEGLASIYQLNADKKVKCKAFSALQSLETDLGILAQLQTFMKEPFNLVHKSPVGILEKRKGGHAMKLTYFVSPYDLIDKENKTCENLSLEAVISKKVGHSVTVCMEGSTSHKLPTSSIITVNRGPTGKSTPSYAALNSVNSSMLPACFVLKLAIKMPMCMELIRRIQKVTELECTDISTPAPLLSMIVQHSSNNRLDCKNNRGLFVNLPDQYHCYFMTENKNMEGVLVGSIPFTHPAHVPQILVYLRQQALFNTLISTCVRSMSKPDLEDTTMFEISALSWQCISISLEHPFEETMATAELDLTDISAIKCRLYGVNLGNTDQISDIGGKVIQRCLSIPLTMRTLIKIWEGRTSIANHLNSTNSNGSSYNINNIGNSLNNRETMNQNGTNSNADFNPEDIKIKQEPGTLNGTTAGNNLKQQQPFLEVGAENSIGFPPSCSGQSDTVLNPIHLGNLLSQVKVPPGTTVTPNNNNNNSSAIDKSSLNSLKKVRKRKIVDASSSSVSSSWIVPKRKIEQIADTSEILLDSSSSDSTPLGTPKDSNNDVRTPTPTSAHDPLEILSCTSRSSDYETNLLDAESEVMEIEPPIHSLIIEDVSKRRSSSSLSKKRNSNVSDDSKHSPTSILFDDNKSLVSPSVSITPISSNTSTISSNQQSQQLSSNSYNSMLSSMGLEKRPGIEIIPIQLPQTSLPSSITITAITNPLSKSSSDDRNRDRKNFSSQKNRSSSLDDINKSKLDKKRKRKREESPMGPPDKLPLKQDPLSKPVSVTIKPSESPPSSSSRPSSPAAATLRKFSPSPTQFNPLVSLGKSSPTSLRQSPSSSSSSKHISPKQSPAYSSPKHTPTMPASVSPKHGMSSPKNGSSGSSGKPSMSALKSVTTSPIGNKNNDAITITPKNKITSPSSSSSSSSSLSNSALLSCFPSVTLVPASSSGGSKDLMRDKEKKNFSFSPNQSPKSKNLVSPNNKPKTSECESSMQLSTESTTPPSDLSKSAASLIPAPRGRKGSLIAVIDKLKNAQHCTEDSINITPKPLMLSSSNTSSTSTSSVSKSSLMASGKIGLENKNNNNKTVSVDNKNPEYMVKPNSSDGGIKITINKTKKDAKSSNNVKMSPAGSSATLTTSGTGSISPKTYTGLKPGVNSGPASKKPQAQTSPKLISSGKSLIQGNQKPPLGFFNKGAAGLKSTSSSTKTTSQAADLSKAREKSRLKASDKNMFSSSGSGLSGLPSVMVEERKKLDTNFQIPKLSAREKGNDKMDYFTKTDLSSKSSSNSNQSSSASDEYLSPNLSQESDTPTNLSMQSEDNNKYSDSSDISIASSLIGGAGSSGYESLNLSIKKSSEDVIDGNSACSSQSTSSQEAAEILLDFSSSKDTIMSSPIRKNQSPPLPPPPPPMAPTSLMSSQSLSSGILSAAVPLTAALASMPLASPISSNYPPSPAVSVHIVKSPVPSPRVIPLSPHSASPCITTDDELMDEALVSMGK